MIGAAADDSPWRPGGTTPHRLRKAVQLDTSRPVLAQSRPLLRLNPVIVRVGVIFGLSSVAIWGFTSMRSRSATPQQESLFSIVIDAGSTGSRVHVFRFDGVSGRLLDVGGEAEVYRSTKPGLSACSRNRTCLPELLQPLLDAAAAAVPAEQQPSTPIAVRATAGLRMLPGDQADQLLEETRKFVEGYNFLDAGVEVMSGDDEGKFQWIAVNSLLGALAPGGTPVVVIDLGGGSVQIAYAVGSAAVEAMEGERREAYIRELDLPGQAAEAAASVYQHSYLGYGLMAARAKMLQEAELLGKTDANPCLLIRAEVLYTYNNHTFLSQGSGQADACAHLAQQMLHREAPCGDGLAGYEGCSFDGVWAGPGWGGSSGNAPAIAACSFFFDGLQDAGAISQDAGEASVTPATYKELAAKACATLPEDAAAAYPLVSAERARWMCFDLSYLAVLLTSGFGFSEEQPLRAVKEITHEGLTYGATWALGLALERLQPS